jgi:hypothetical protein
MRFEPPYFLISSQFLVVSIPLTPFGCTSSDPIEMSVITNSGVSLNFIIVKAGYTLFSSLLYPSEIYDERKCP